MSRLYVVRNKTTNEKSVVEGTSQAAAIAIKAREVWEAYPATAREVAEIMGGEITKAAAKE